MVLTMGIEIVLIAMIVAAVAFRMGTSRRVKVRGNELTRAEQRKLARLRALRETRQPWS